MSCYLCGVESSEVLECDRWNFGFKNENGQVEEDGFWLCRDCHGNFSSIEEFDKFREDITRSRIYRSTSQLNRLLLLNAPSVIISNQIKVLVGRAMQEPKIALKLEEYLKSVLRIGCIDTEESSNE